MDPYKTQEAALSNMFMQMLPTDNMVARYVINFVALALVATVMSRINAFQDKMWNLWEKIKEALFHWNENELELYFIARDVSNTYCSGLVATDEYKAWLTRIREIILDKKSSYGNQLGKLREFQERHSYWETDDENGGDKTNKKTAWIPNQEQNFQLTEDIWCSSWISESEDGKRRGEGGGGETSQKVKEYNLRVFIKDESKRHLLLDYHNKLMSEYYEKAQLSLNSKPHIFEFSKTDEETGRLVWNQYPFSSTRRMKHVWFQQKEAFTQAYEYFLNNRAAYERRGDPWTFSCLLYGLPGCGKTSLIKAIVNHALDRSEMAHVFMIPFNKIQSAEILTQVIFDETVNGNYIPLSQRILIFEDFDANEGAKVFKKRDQQKRDEADMLDRYFQAERYFQATIEKSKTETSVADEKKQSSPAGDFMKKEFSKLPAKLSLAEVLNILDGVNERTGQRCFWTTNCAPPEDHFDAAFLRPGRMDMIIEFTKCDKNGISYLLRQYYGEETCDEDTLSLIPDGKWTPARVKQACKEHKSMDECLEWLARTTILERGLSLTRSHSLVVAETESDDIVVEKVPTAIGS